MDRHELIDMCLFHGIQNTNSFQRARNSLLPTLTYPHAEIGHKTIPTLTCKVSLTTDVSEFVLTGVSLKMYKDRLHWFSTMQMDRSQTPMGGHITLNGLLDT
jgi:hypothetical protein